MNKDWAEKNKRMQSLIGKEASFREGLDVLFELRNDLFGQISSIVKTYPAEAFYQMPFAGAEGYTARHWLIPCGTSSGSRILSPIR